MNRRPLNPDDIFDLKCPGDLRLSPDGKSLLYVIQYSDKSKEKSFTDIYLAGIETGESRKLTNSGKDRSPRWSPDGKRVAFVSDRSGKAQIWMIDPRGGEAWRLATKETVQSDPVWSPDGSRIFFISDAFSKPDDWSPYPGAPDDDRERAIEQARRAIKAKDGKRQGDKDRDKDEDGDKPNDIRVITRLRYRMDGVGYYGDLRKHVFCVEVPGSIPGSIPGSVPREDSESSSQVTSGDFDHGTPCATPLGEYILLSAVRRDDADYLQKSDLHLVETSSGKSILLYEGPGPVNGPQMSLDGRYVAFLGHDQKRGVSTRTDLWVLPTGSFMDAVKKGESPEALTAGDALNLTAHLDLHAGGLAGADPRYGRSGPLLIWDGGVLYFPLQDHAEVFICAASPVSDTLPTTVTGPSVNQGDVPGSGWVIDRVLGQAGRPISGYDVKQGILAYQASSARETEDIFLRKNRDGEEMRLTSSNDEFLEGIATGDWEKFQYRSCDGQELDGWVIYPHGYEKGKTYPTVLLVHGGPHGAYSSAFTFSGQFFASHGYAVIYCNPRGSISYGQEFMACIDADWGNKDFADVMSCVDAATARGFVDEKNIFVHGWSYGGYWTVWAVTQTSRFRAACAGACVSNLHSDYGTSDIMWADEHEYGGKPWENAGLLLDRSALSHVDKVTTPILLLHGENDLRCPVSQTEQFYVGLRRLGKTAVMVRYPGEFHGLKRPLHRIDRFKRMLAWFEHYRRD